MNLLSVFFFFMFSAVSIVVGFFVLELIFALLVLCTTTARTIHTR